MLSLCHPISTEHPLIQPQGVFIFSPQVSGSPGGSGLMTVCWVNPCSSKIISKSNTAVARPDSGSTAAKATWSQEQHSPWHQGAQQAPWKVICHRLPCGPKPPSELQGCVLLAEVLPHPTPHSPLLNCVIIFKQINSIAEFSRPNDEFAVQIPLISLSPENQLMNDTQCFLREALRQPCTSSRLPRDTAPLPCLQLLPTVGVEVKGQRRLPSPSLDGRNGIAGSAPAPAPVTQGLY